MSGKRSRRKGRQGENEIVKLLGDDAKRVSEAGSPGPDVWWNGHYIEVRRRKEGYESMNVITSELEGEATLYMTRLDRKPWYVTLKLAVLQDMLDEAFSAGVGDMLDDVRDELHGRDI